MMNSHACDAVNLTTINQAAKRIANIAKKTPVMTNSFMNERSGGRNLHFKCELFQKTGSFKFRGACNAILQLKQLKQETPVVVTHSSGNHAQALALAAKLNGIEAIIVTPDGTIHSKKEAVKGYGAQLVTCENTPAARESTVANIVAELGSKGEFVPSSDHPFIMSGQGTAGLEFLEQVPELDAVLVCCSIGGFLAGVATACKSIKPSIKVYGAEPALADDTYRSLKSGERFTFSEFPQTIADGLRMSVGVHTWPIIKELVDDVILVSEQEIVDTMYLMWERMKLVVEPSGAVPLACVLSKQFRNLPSDIKNVGVFISGGNVNLKNLPWNK